MGDIVLVDKPKGITSFGVIKVLRKKLNIKKIGHAGTLDPLATGLMILGVGKGTKKLENYLKLDKVYEADVLLGIKTTTADLEGEITDKKTVKELDLDTLMKVLSELEGTHELPIPMFSAKKVNGKKLYELARANQTIETQTKLMTFHYIKLLSHQSNKDNTYLLKLETKVSSGTFIRTLAEQIGEMLGLPSTLGGLRRIQIGPFNVSKSDFGWDDIKFD